MSSHKAKLNPNIVSIFGNWIVFLCLIVYMFTPNRRSGQCWYLRHMRACSKISFRKTLFLCFIQRNLTMSWSFTQGTDLLLDHWDAFPDDGATVTSVKVVCKLSIKYMKGIMAMIRTVIEPKHFKITLLLLYYFNYSKVIWMALHKLHIISCEYYRILYMTIVIRKSN